MNAMGRSIGKPFPAPYVSMLIACAGLCVVLSGCGGDDDAPVVDSAPHVAVAPSSESLTGARAGADNAPGRSSRDVDPSTTGRITGLVIHEGAVPPREPLSVVGEAFCMGLAGEGEGILSETLVVSEGRLAGAFLWIAEGLDDWRFPRADGFVELDQRGCAYVPHVLGLRKGQTLRLLNSDPVLHNVHSVGQRNGEKNLAMPQQGQTVEMKFKRPEIMIQMQCDVHAWMKGYVGVVDHPCFDVSGGDGSFTIESVPPGDYVLRLWHETLGTTEVEVTVAANETVALGELSF